MTIECRMTDAQIGDLVDRLLARGDERTEEEARVVRDGRILLGESTPTGEDEAEIHARVRAAFVARNAEVDLDGTLHVRGACCDEHSILGEVCRRPGCGGRVHVQPIYGGLWEVCERCEVDRASWRPRGSLLAEDMVGGFGVEGSGIFGEIGGADSILGILARISATGDCAPDVAAAESWLEVHDEDPGAHAVRAFLRSHAEGRRRREEDLRRASTRISTSPTSTSIPCVASSRTAMDFVIVTTSTGVSESEGPHEEPNGAQGLWSVAARHRKTGRVRQWAAIASTLDQALGRARDALRTAVGERRGDPEDYDAWCASPAAPRLVVEIDDPSSRES